MQFQASNLWLLLQAVWVLSSLAFLRLNSHAVRVRAVRRLPRMN